MCYGNNGSRNYVTKDASSGATINSSVALALSVSVSLMVPQQVTVFRPMHYWRGKSIPDGNQAFLIESFSFGLTSLTKEDLLDLIDDIVRYPEMKKHLRDDFNRGFITAYGRWSLKSGGYAKDTDSINLKFSEVPNGVLNAIHNAVGVSLDSALNDITGMYDTYSEVINLSFQKDDLVHAVERTPVEV